MAQSLVSNNELQEIRAKLEKLNPGKVIRAWQIKDVVRKRHGVSLDESTIRGRFLALGQPLSGGSIGKGSPATEPEEPESATPRGEIEELVSYKQLGNMEKLNDYIPTEEDFSDYIERDIDKRLAIHYNLGPEGKGSYKYPITQGKQGTGKTYSHAYYAHRMGLPFFLFSGHKHFELEKLFGDKTIINGSVVFQENLFTKAIQGPSVILFDEINAISNEGTFPFHALLQNRELFIKDADDGRGKVYKLDSQCRIGFAQNPKSAKYIGGCIKPSNFLGRCTYLTYPEFTKEDLTASIKKRFPVMEKNDTDKFTKYYFAIIEVIERSNLPVDISIRQLNNVIDLWMAGMNLKDALEDGLHSMLEAVSQPKAKESFLRIAQAIWKQLM